MTASPSCQVITPTLEQVPALVRLVDNAMRAGSNQSMGTDYPLIFREKNLKNIRAIQVDGEIVSQVTYLPHTVSVDDCRFTVGMISQVATHPEHRKKGYALVCLKACLEQMERDGITLSVLWTLPATFPFYEHAGFQAVRSMVNMYPCYREDAPLFARGAQRVVTYDPQTRKYLADIQRLHEQEITGVLRTEEDYETLFALPKIKTYLALENERPVAYLVASRATNKPGLVEGGGEEAALETLMTEALSTLPEGASPIRAYGYLTPSALGDLLERRIPERRQPWVGNMMIRMNNVEAFFQAICPWLARRNGGRDRAFSLEITDTGQRVAFHFTRDGLQLAPDGSQQSIPLTRQTLTSCVFGEHLERRTALPVALQGLFPFYFPLCILDHC